MQARTVGSGVEWEQENVPCSGFAVSSSRSFNPLPTVGNVALERPESNCSMITDTSDVQETRIGQSRRDAGGLRARQLWKTW